MCVPIAGDAIAAKGLPGGDLFAGGKSRRCFYRESADPDEVPRVYDREERRHVPLEYYRKLREMTDVDEHLTASVLLGLSMGDYGRVVHQLLDSFGLSRSSVSRRFIQESREKLREFEERRLDGYRMVALFIDGKEFEKEQIVIVLGVTEDGRKIPLGFVQSHTENGRAIAGLLRNLLDRGLQIEDGLLWGDGWFKRDSQGGGRGVWPLCRDTTLSMA